MSARLVEIGTFLSSRTRARLLRQEVLAELGHTEGPITFDLNGVECISDSFADELFAVLAVDKGEEWFAQRIKIINASREVRASILRALEGRFAQDRAPSVTTQGSRFKAPPESIVAETRVG